MIADGDPNGKHRIQVQVPTAGIDRIGARLLGWFDHDPGFPKVLGSLCSHRIRPPTPTAADTHGRRLMDYNPIKAIVARCKATLALIDEDRFITLQAPAGNQAVISDKDGSIVITDQNENRFKLGRDGILMNRPQDILVSAKGAASAALSALACRRCSSAARRLFAWATPRSTAAMAR